MLSSVVVSSLLAGASLAATTTSSSSSSINIPAAQATAETRSPISHVPGKAFDRIYIVFLENTNYDLAAADPNLSWLASQGVTLSNYCGVTHPSEPNYVASHLGDNFGMDNDNFNLVASNVSSVVDLLEDKGISWGEYQEDMPYSGYTGYQYLDAVGANDYVRKHNPAVIAGDNQSKQRLAQMKNFTLFEKNLENGRLPQWAFITPNMTDDGHDSSVTVAGAWARRFFTPLLNNPKFMNNTLVLLTFDENETYETQNNVLAIAFGDSVPKNLIGTTDSAYYNHYSLISTVEANWGLHTLGRWDTGANVFSWVAAKTGDTVRKWSGKPAFNKIFFNESYPGPFNSVNSSVAYPVPNTKAVVNGRTVLPAIVDTWGKLSSETFYTTNIEIPDGQHPPAGY